MINEQQFNSLQETIRLEVIGALSEIEANFREHNLDYYGAKLLPSVLYRPKIYMDGNKWCALYGKNIQDGVCGFGDTPEEAMNEFDIEFRGNGSNND